MAVRFENSDWGGLPPDEEEAFGQLLEASSLGSPQAKAIRAMADPEAVAEVRKRLARLTAEEAQ